ncbi:MAG: HAD family hydrolase [Promethearchaeota archaeon]
MTNILRNKLGVFDFDKTIVNNLTGVELAGELHKIGKFSKYEKFMNDQDLLDYCKRDEYEEGLKHLSNLFADSVKGLTEEEMKQCLDSLEKKIKINFGFEELYYWLKKRNYKLMIISSSPIECTQLITGKYPFDYCFAFELTRKNGVYTGDHKGVMTVQKKIGLVDRYLTNCISSFGVGNVSDIDVFRSLDLKFLLDDEESKDNDDLIRISNLSQIKNYLKKITI